MRFRYKPEVGDIVVGRVIEVCIVVLDFEIERLKPHCTLAYAYLFRLLKNVGE